jgi:pimeloyl-ACP methyl ester carboxylesterase
MLPSTRRPSFSICAALAIVALATIPALAAGPTVNFTLPPENSNPSVFGSVPWPSDLYFDQGEQTDGDGTLLNNGANIGLSVDVVRNTNYTATLERGLDTMDGFGVTTGCFFFFSGSIDGGSLPTSPRVTPAVTDSVLLVDLSDSSLVPIELKANVDTRIPNALSVIPLGGHPLKPQTQYACVVTTAVTGGGMAVVPTADFVGARTHASANTDANNIYGNAADTVAAIGGGPAVANIAGMAVFTTQSTLESLRLVQTAVLPSLAMPTADFSATQVVFKDGTANDLTALYGVTPHSHLSIVATGYFNSPRFQTNDPNGNGPSEDLPHASNLAAPCDVPCEPNDEVFVYTSPTDKTPIIQGPGVTIPFTVTIPNGTAPVNGWPIMIDQHGLGGDRKIVADLADTVAAAGFASIGIDAVAHGYRFLNPDGTAAGRLQPDHANGYGGTAVPDGFADGSILFQPIGSISTSLGFFNGFNNIVGTGDNFRQTCADLMQLVRLIQSNSIDGQLGVNIDENNIFYIGHSLGGIMGSCLAAFEPDIKAYALNATGGGLTSKLLLNSSIGAGALGSLNTIFTLDPANVADKFAIFPNITQSLLDHSDPEVEAEAWIKSPVVGGPRNLMQISDDSDEVVPNQANEAVGLSSGLEIFDPFLQNLLLAPESMPITATTGTVSGNGPSGVTAFYLQQGPAAHASTVTPFLSSLSFVPGHAIVSEWPNAFPTYERSVRIQNAYVLPNILAWFADIAQNGAPGTFDYTTPPNFNPLETINVTSGPSSHTFFDRTINAGGAVSYQEPTSDVTVSFTANNVASRVSADRSILGATALATTNDLPPGVSVLSNDILPFFTTVQKNPAGTFSADLTIDYTTADLARAGIPDGSPAEAGLQIARVGGPGTCLVGGAACANSAACGTHGPCVELLPTTVDMTNNTVTTTGLTHFSIFAVVNPTSYAPALQIPGQGKPSIECALEWLMSNPAGAAVLDKFGHTSFKQSCTDGDPSCDFDNTPGQCTFQMAMCVNVVDPSLGSCSSDSITAIDVLKPSANDALNPNKPGDNLNRAALLGLFDADGPILLPDTRDNDCALVNLVVPMKVGPMGLKSTRKNLKVRATFLKAGDRIKDSDVLKLTCNP